MFKRTAIIILLILSFAMANHKFVNVESNGGVAVNIQDQTTEPQVTYFIRSIGTFTLSQDVAASTVTTLNKTIELTAGHSIVAGDEILLLNVSTGKDFYAEAVSVTTNTVTLDRPIDADFPSALALGREVSSQMAVDGSTTPVIFTVRSGTVPADITRVIIQMTHSGTGDDSKFGDQTSLTNGLVFRIVDSFQKTIFNFKNNGDIRGFCYDLGYSDKAGGGLNGTGARITFAGQDKHGVTLRIADDDVIQWVVQDDLTGLSSLKIVAQGHLVSD